MVEPINVDEDAGAAIASAVGVPRRALAAGAAALSWLQSNTCDMRILPEL